MTRRQLLSPPMRYFHRTLVAAPLAAKPKKRDSAAVESYQTVSVNCNSCGLKLFRYKKKNGTKSSLIKCYVERIVDDSASVLILQQQQQTAITMSAADTEGKHSHHHHPDSPTAEYTCPSCQTRFARWATIKGLPALKLVGGKVRMTKK